MYKVQSQIGRKGTINNSKFKRKNSKLGRKVSFFEKNACALVYMKKKSYLCSRFCEKLKNNDMTTSAKILTWTSVIAFIALALFIFIKFFFVYAEGVNEGDINYFQKEGYIFKTYEGKMIQSGLKSANGVQGSIQSNEFKFSVDNEAVAKRFSEVSNTGVKLHWNRYLGSLPWRGNSQFIVDSIYSSRPEKPSATKAEPTIVNSTEMEAL